MDRSIFLRGILAIYFSLSFYVIDFLVEAPIGVVSPSNKTHKESPAVSVTSLYCNLTSYIFEVGY